MVKCGTIALRHVFGKRLQIAKGLHPNQSTLTTTTATTTAATRVMKRAESARIHELRRAMCAWRADPVGGRTRLVTDVAREPCPAVI